MAQLRPISIFASNVSSLTSDSFLLHLPNDFQLLIQPFGGNWHCGSKLLSEKRYFELFNHPPEGFDFSPQSERPRWLDLKFVQLRLVRRNLMDSLLLFYWIQRRAFTSD